MSDTSFDQYTRVSILKEPVLPLDVAAALAGRVRWLRHEVEAIDAEIGLRYPPIEVVPVCWFHLLRDGTAGNVPALVTMRPWEAHNRYVVRVTAPALLEYSEDMVTGMLAHEFLHVVFNTLAIARHVEANPAARIFRRPGEHQYAESWEHYQRIDAAWQVDASAWLSPRLQRLADLADGEGPLVTAAIARMKSNWIDKDLPIERITLDIDFHGIAVDDAIIKRASTLYPGCEIQTNLTHRRHE